MTLAMLDHIGKISINVLKHLVDTDTEKDTVLLGVLQGPEEIMQQLSIMFPEKTEEQIGNLVDYLRLLRRDVCRYAVTDDGRLIPNSIKLLKTRNLHMEVVKLGNTPAFVYLQLPVGRIMVYRNDVLCSEIADFLAYEIPETTHESKEPEMNKGKGTGIAPLTAHIAEMVRRMRNPAGKNLFGGK